MFDSVIINYSSKMSTVRNLLETDSPSENEPFGPEFTTDVHKVGLASPANERPLSTIDPFEDRVHDMTASYSEISIDSQASPPILDDLFSFDQSPISTDMTFGAKRRYEDDFDEALPDCDSRRPDRLDLLRSNAGSLEQSYHNTISDLCLEGTVTKEGDMVLFVAEDLESKIKLSSPVTKKGDTPPFPGTRTSTPCLYRQALMPQLPVLDPNILNDLELEVRRVATSVDTLTENLAGILHSVSALTVECLETYCHAVCKTCDAVDSNIKSMYQLMAKCEELSKSMEPIYKLSEQIKGIKRLLDLFENAVP